MSKEYINIHEWAKEEMDKLVREEAKNYGFRKGHEEGIKEGMEKGIEQGIEQGIEINKIEMIKSMLKKHISYKDIAEISGIKIEEIKEIEESTKEN